MDPQEFTTEDWYTVLQGTTAVTGLVMMSDLSGPIGMAKEATAAMEALRADTWKTPFIAAFRTAVFAATKEQQEQLQAIANQKQAELKEQKLTPEQGRELSLQAIRDSVTFVGEKAGPEAAEEYRQLLYQVAVDAAEAGKEGTFLGFGGTRVSAKEQAALDEIKGLLGL